MTDFQTPTETQARDIVHDIAAALHDPDDRENLLGMLFVEHGMERAKEIMRVLARRGERAKSDDEPGGTS